MNSAYIICCSIIFCIRKFLRGPGVRASQSGFTLIEVMVVVSIIAILLTLASPLWRSLIDNNRTRSAANEWIASTQFARSEALRTNGPITICKSSDGASCNTDVATGFEIGWIVKIGTIGASGAVLQDTISKDGVSMASSLGALTFLPNGLPSGNFSGLSIAVTSAYADAASASIKHICMARTGRVRVFSDQQYSALVPAESCTT